MIKSFKYKTIVVFILVLTSIPFSLYAEDEVLAMKPEKAYERGKLLYQQNKYSEAIPYLNYATEEGYAGAALMLSITYNTNIFIQTPREAEYAHKAAELGSVIGALKSDQYNLKFLKKNHIKKAMLPQLNSLANAGNAFAMRQVYNWIEDRDDAYDWLIKAAEAGDAFSQHELAQRYLSGDDWFLIPGKREREIERLLKAASDSGYREGMLAYAKLLKKNGDNQGYQKIIDELVALGDAEVIRTLGSYYRQLGNYRNAAYYNQIFLDSMGNEGHNDAYDTVEFFQNRIITNLTEQELAEINSKVAEFLATHTVHYQKRIEEYEYTLESLRQQTKK